jgi:hypothetical protein
MRLCGLSGKPMVMDAVRKIKPLGKSFFIKIALVILRNETL